MKSTYYDLFGLLVMEYGDFGQTDFVISSIEDAIAKFPNRLEFAYRQQFDRLLPIIVAYFFKEHIGQFTILPGFPVLLHVMGVKSRNFLHYKTQLIEMGVIQGRFSQNLEKEREKCIELLLQSYPVSVEIKSEIQVLMNLSMLWNSMKPIVAACCILAIVCQNAHLGYPTYKIAHSAKVSPSAVYNRIKFIQARYPLPLIPCKAEEISQPILN